MRRNLYCFGANRICHHYDYHLLIRNLLNDNNIEVHYIKYIRSKFILLLKRDPIVFLDIDKYDILFLPLIIIRNLFAKHSFAISVRTERLLWSQAETIYDIMILLLKRIVFFIIKNVTNTTLITIHNDKRGKLYLNNYVNEYIYDIQYWDVKYLDIRTSKPRYSIIDKIDFDNTVLIPGRFNVQKSKEEFLKAINTNSDISFLIAGKIDDDIEGRLKIHKNIHIINEFLSDEELFFLIERCEYIYCYYPLNYDRPSGFFGRAIQLNKKVIVRKNSYLSREFRSLENVIEAESLNFLGKTIASARKNQLSRFDLDSSQHLKRLLSS